MEVSARRLLILSSHISPPAEASQAHSTCLLVDSPASTSAGDTDPKTDKVDAASDCVFCKIIGGQSPALKLYEDEECICILDKYPLCHGHSLIIPKCHFPSLDMTPPLIIGSMCSKIPLISDAIMKATGCGVHFGSAHDVSFINNQLITHSFNLLVNNGAAAGQVVYHTHIHIIPRKSDDCLWTSESIRRRKLKLDGEALLLVNQIRENILLVNASEEIPRLSTDRMDMQYDK